MGACEKFREQMSAYVDGELNEQECAELEAHLAHCADCAQRLAMLELLHEEFPSMDAEPPAELCENVMRTVRVGAKKPHLLSRFRFTVAAAVIAVVLIAASFNLDQFMPKVYTESNDIAVQQSEIQQENQTTIPRAELRVGKDETDSTPAGQSQQETTVQTPPESDNEKQNNVLSSQQPEKGDQQDAKASATKPSGQDKSSGASQAESKPARNTNPSKTEQNADKPDQAGASVAEANSSDSTPAQAEMETSAKVAPESNTALPESAAVGDDSAANSSNANGSSAGAQEGDSLPMMSAPSENIVNGALENTEGADMGAGMSGSASAPDSTTGGTQSSSVLPQIPYSRTFAFYIMVDPGNIPEIIADLPCEVHDGNTFIIVDSELHSQIIEQLKSLGIDYTEVLGDSQQGDGLFIILAQ